MGSNGSDTIESYLQSKKHEGENLRDFNTRPELTPVENLLVTEIRGLKKDVKEFKACKDECNLGEFKDHIGHGTGVIKNAGDGESIPVGLNALEAQGRFTKGLMNAAATGKSLIFAWLVKGALGVAAVIIALGFWELLFKGMIEKIKQGGV